MWKGWRNKGFIYTVLAGLNLVSFFEKFGKSLYFAVFFIVLVYFPWGAFPFTVFKFSWFVFVSALSLIATGIYFLRKEKPALSFNYSLFAVLALGLVSRLFANVFSIAPVESFWGTYGRFDGVFTFILIIVHFFICLSFFRDRNFLNNFFKIVFWIGAIVSSHAILQKFNLDPLGLSQPESFAGRVAGLFGSPVFLGQWLIFPLVTGFWCIITERKSRLWSGLYLAGIFLMAAALLFSFNRASIIALVVTAFIGGFYYFYTNKKKWLWPAGLFLLLAAAVFVLLNTGLRSFDSRLVLWRDAAPVLAGRLLTGHGPETFYQTFQTVMSRDVFLTETLFSIPDRLHNETLQIIHDYGILGLTFYLAQIVFLVWVFIKKKIKGLPASAAYYSILACLISVQFSFFDLSGMIYLAAMWAILLGTVIKFRPVKVDLSAFGRVFAVVVILAGLGGMYFSYNLVAVDYLTAKALNNFGGNEKVSFDLFGRAALMNVFYQKTKVDFISLFASPELVKNDSSASAALEGELVKIGKIDNYSFEYYLAAANLAESKGSYKEAVNDFNFAISKAPNLPLVWQSFGAAAFGQKDYGNAISAFEKLISLAPPYFEWGAKKNLSFEDKEKYRIFRKTHALFYYSMTLLVEAYNLEGRSADAGLLLLKIN